MDTTTLQRSVEWTPAFDKRPIYGIHGMNLRFLLRGPEGTTQFLIYTNWLLKPTQEEGDALVDQISPHHLCHPLPADLGYHSLRPVYAGQKQITQACYYLDGRPCFYDGSALQAEELYWRFVEQGDTVVWKELEEMYWDMAQRAAILPLTTGPNGQTEEPTT